MVRSISSFTSTLRSYARVHRARALAAALAGTVLLWDSTAHAINALVSQDIPWLTQIASTEMMSYGELGSILAETAAVVKQVKEYTAIAKTVYGAIDDVRHLSLGELKGYVMQGVLRAAPELGGMYQDLKDIRDLDYRNDRALATIRGALWEEVYGPAIDYLHSGHQDLDAIAVWEDERNRSAGKIEAERKQLDAWKKACEKAADAGAEGACQAAAQRAALESGFLLADLHDTNLKILESQQLAAERADRRELDEVYAFSRFLGDVQTLLASPVSKDGDCRPGSCLYDRYADKVYERIQEYRIRHPQEFRGGTVRSPWMQ